MWDNGEDRDIFQEEDFCTTVEQAISTAADRLLGGYFLHEARIYQGTTEVIRMSPMDAVRVKKSGPEILLKKIPAPVMVSEKGKPGTTTPLYN